MKIDQCEQYFVDFDGKMNHFIVQHIKLLYGFHINIVKKTIFVRYFGLFSVIIDCNQSMHGFNYECLNWNLLMLSTNDLKHEIYSFLGYTKTYIMY